MSPTSREINGARLAPLKVHRDSHMIQKSTSGAASSSSSTASSNHASRRHPVIIYTHSPKVIHTHARDFMALVQKLTGRSDSTPDDHAAAADQPSLPPPSPPLPPPPRSLHKDCPGGHDELSSSSENYSYSTLSTAATVAPIGFESFAPSTPYLLEVPLCTSSSPSDYYSTFYRYPEHMAYNHNVTPDRIPLMENEY